MLAADRQETKSPSTGNPDDRLARRLGQRSRTRETFFGDGNVRTARPQDTPTVQIDIPSAERIKLSRPQTVNAATCNHPRQPSEAEAGVVDAAFRVGPALCWLASELPATIGQP